MSALKSVLGGRELAWVGWSGEMGGAPTPFRLDGICNRAVPLSEEEFDDYYTGFANRTLWPLFHDAIRPPEYHRRWWRQYVDVNRRFAEAASASLAQNGNAWVHDYHLLLVPKMLRELRPDVHISFFLHIPFPPEELFAQLPWRRELLEGVLGADVIGFQTRLGAQNFARLARRFTNAQGSDELLEIDGHLARSECYPISIDTPMFERMANEPHAAAAASALRERFGAGRKIILGVDRLDYTKGIDLRLRAYETFLERNPELRDHVSFVQVAVPSRRWVPEYQEIQTRVEQLVGRINGRFGKPGQVPVQYLCQSIPQGELVSYYRAADVMVVTPFRDGMNLVAKEYVATRTDDRGVLILSEFTGAAKELQSALLVNPHDIDGVAVALEGALSMPEPEEQSRMSALRKIVQQHNVHQWADHCLGRVSL